MKENNISDISFTVNVDPLGSVMEDSCVRSNLLLCKGEKLRSYFVPSCSASYSYYHSHVDTGVPVLSLAINYDYFYCYCNGNLVELYNFNGPLASNILCRLRQTTSRCYFIS